MFHMTLHVVWDSDSCPFSLRCHRAARREQGYPSVCQKPTDSGIASLNISADLFAAVSSPLFSILLLFHSHRESATRRNLVRKERCFLTLEMLCIIFLSSFLLFLSFCGNDFQKVLNLTSCFLWLIEYSHQPLKFYF